MVVWLVVAVLALIGEVLSFDLFLASVAAAAIVTAGLAGVLSGTLQVVVFAGLSLTGIAFVRPAIKQALGIESRQRDGGAAVNSRLVGRRGVVTRAIDCDVGQIRVGEGEFWTARAFDPAQTISPGTEVDVLLVDALTAVVAPIPRPTPESTLGAVSTGAPNGKAT